MNRMINRILQVFRLLSDRLYTPETYARKIGVNIGNNCRILSRNWSSEPYLITIGNHCTIAKNVSIHTHGGGSVLNEHCPDFDVFGKVVIEDWAYIGTGAQIMPGVTIGEGALIAAGSVVTKSIPPHTVVGGNPARFICSSEDYYKKNKPYNVKTRGLTPQEKKKIILSLSDGCFIKKPYIKTPQTESSE